MTIKPFLNQMSADLASTLTEGKSAVARTSADGKSLNTGDHTADLENNSSGISFKDALNQAIDPKSKKGKTGKTAQPFASALKVNGTETQASKNTELVTVSPDSQNDSEAKDSGDPEQGQPTDDLSNALLSVAPPLIQEKPESGLTLLSLAQASLLEQAPSLTADMHHTPSASLDGQSLSSPSSDSDLSKPTGSLSLGSLSSQLDKTSDSLAQNNAQPTDPDGFPGVSLLAFMATTPHLSNSPLPQLAKIDSPAKSATPEVLNSNSNAVIPNQQVPSMGLPLAQTSLAQSFSVSLPGANHLKQDSKTELDTNSIIETQTDNSSSSSSDLSGAANASDIAGYNNLQNSDPLSADLSTHLKQDPFTSLDDKHSLSTPIDLDQQVQNQQSQNLNTEAAAPVLNLQMQAQTQAQSLTQQGFASLPFAFKNVSKADIQVERLNVQTQAASSQNSTTAPPLKASVSNQPIINQIGSMSPHKTVELFKTSGKPASVKAGTEDAASSEVTASTHNFEQVLAQNGVSVEAASLSPEPKDHSDKSTLPIFVSQESSPGDQVMDATAYATKNGHKELILKLNPDNLGEVKINLSSHTDSSGLSAKLIASSVESASLLSQQAESLQASLESKGVKVDKISVIVAGQGELSAIAAGSEANKTQSQNSGQHDHKPDSQPQNQSQNSSFQQQFQQDQHNQQMAQAFQQHMNQSHRQSYYNNQSNSSTANHVVNTGSEAEPVAETTPSPQPQVPGAISVLA